VLRQIVASQVIPRAANLEAEQTEELVPNRWPLVVAHSCDAIMQPELCEEQRALVASELGVESELEAIFRDFHLRH
jgi:hypothetical protein